MSKRYTVAPGTLVLLQFIHQHQPVSTGSAFSLFAGSGESILKFARQLTRLTADSWLDNLGSNHEGVWAVTDKTLALLGRSGGPEPTDDVPPFTGSVAAPRRYDLMHGPLYNAAAASNYRPGAFDYALLPSLLAGKPVPFRGGQHA